jgi:hypothetical protein
MLQPGLHEMTELLAVARLWSARLCRRCASSIPWQGALLAVLEQYSSVDQLKGMPCEKGFMDGVNGWSDNSLERRKQVAWHDKHSRR